MGRVGREGATGDHHLRGHALQAAGCRRLGAPDRRRHARNSRLGDGTTSIILQPYTRDLSDVGDANYGRTIAHELGHYLFGLGDEYGKYCTNIGQAPADVGQGFCFDTGLTAKDSCIMQATSYQFGTPPNHVTFETSELCTPKNHDLDRDPTCLPQSNGKGLPEITRQSMYHNGDDCWTTMASVLTAAGFPVQPPGPFDEVEVSFPTGSYQAPTFVEQLGAATHVVLALDRSGSMGWSYAGDNVEVCGEPNTDRDGDGDDDINEPGCTGTRMERLVEALAQFLSDHEMHALDLKVMWWNDHIGPSYPWGVLEPSTVDTIIQTQVSGVTPSGATALGDALLSARAELSGRVGDRAIYVVTDGDSNVGTDPGVAGASIRNDGILLWAEGIGAASNSAILKDLNQDLGFVTGDDAPENVGASLYQFWAHLRTNSMPVPFLDFLVDPAVGNPETFPTCVHAIDAWLDQLGGPIQPCAQNGANVVHVNFSIPAGTERAYIAIFGKNDRQETYDVEPRLVSPSGQVLTSTTPAGDLTYHATATTESFVLKAPEAGSWRLELRSANAYVQRGFVTIGADQPDETILVEVDPPLVPAAAGASVKVRARIAVHSPVRDLASIRMVVRDPSGGSTSFPMDFDPEGLVYVATISGLQYRGRHQVGIDYRTGSSSIFIPGEPIFPAPSSSTALLEGRGGGTVASFLVESGLPPAGQGCCGDE